MDAHDNAEVMLTIFRAVERRDDEGFKALCQPDVALHWPPALPYGGSFQAGAAGTKQGPNWEETWGPFQPTDAERQMDPRVVAADNDEVVVLWRQRGVSPAGERFDGRSWACISSATESLPARRCCISIQQEQLDSSPRRGSGWRRHRSPTPPSRAASSFPQVDGVVWPIAPR